MKELLEIIASVMVFKVVQFTLYKDENGKDTEYGSVKLQSVKPDTVVGDLEFKGGQITLYAKNVKGVAVGDEITLDPNAYVFKTIDYPIEGDKVIPLKWIYPKG